MCKEKLKWYNEKIVLRVVTWTLQHAIIRHRIGQKSNIGQSLVSEA